METNSSVEKVSLVADTVRAASTAVRKANPEDGSNASNQVSKREIPVNLTSAESGTSRATGEVSPDKGKVAEVVRGKLPNTEKEAEELAKSLEKAINDTKSTEVRFNVAVNAEGSNAFNFQVVEKETGKVLREFPAEKVLELADRAAARGGQGVLVDEAA